MTPVSLAASSKSAKLSEAKQSNYHATSQNVPQYKRDFRRKLIYFRSQPAMRPLQGQCPVTVRRNFIFQDAYDEIMRISAVDLKKRLLIKFHGEDGLDFGGLSR